MHSNMIRILAIWRFVFPVGSVEKNLSAEKETQIWSLGQCDPMKKETATHSSILAWEIPWTEELGGATVHEVIKRVGYDLMTK